MATRKKAAALPDWDADSAALRANLAIVDQKIHRLARQSTPPGIESARSWHTVMMKGLNPGDPAYVCSFRGEPGLETVGVEVGGVRGTMPWEVEGELSRFEARLERTMTRLDSLYPNSSLDDNGRSAVIEFAAWAHSEWVRIHPFANGNGRTARMWANLIMLRYGMPPALRLRPRPDASDYARAGAAGMYGDHAPMAALLGRLHDATVKANWPTAQARATRARASEPAVKKTGSKS